MAKYILFLIVLVFTTDKALDAQVQVNINGALKQHTISPLIQGMGIIYSFEADSLYEDGRLARIYKDAGVGFLRWPGGAVTTFYHWNDLNGQGWMDNWKPGYDYSNDKDPVDYMDLDEYMALCREAETEPMLGINMSSGMEWDREEDALNEAVDLVKYCIAQDFNVNYIYLDNETYHTGNSFNADPDNDGESWTAELYGEKINLYADSIRKYLPEVKLIPNWKRNIKNGNASLKTLINVAGENIDYIDVHWYWKWGEASWEEWIAKSPMEMENEWYDGGTIADEVESFASLTTDLGHPHIKLASLEWNIGPGPWSEDPNHNKFRTSLMQSEMQMQMMQGGLEIGSLWAAHWPGTEDASDRFLLDPDEGHTPNPIAKVYELYKNALNGVLLSNSTSDSEVSAAAVVQDNSKAFVFVLNKKMVYTNLNIEMDGYDILSVDRAVCFKDPGIIEDIAVVQHANLLSTLLPGYTLSMFEFQVEQSNDIFTDRAEDKASIHVWPNPASGTVSVKLNGCEGDTNLSLYNMLGIRLLSQSFNVSESDQFSFNSLPSGTYLLNVTDKFGKNSSSRFIVE